MREITGLVLLGDVEESRSIADREAFRVELESVCARVSEQHAQELVVPVVVLKGADELGCVLKSYRSVFAIVSEFNAALPYPVRFALGRGVIDAGVDSGDIARMDGPAFHVASEAMAGLKASKLPFAMRGGDRLVDDALSAAISAAVVFRASRSEAERKAIDAYVVEGNQTKAGAVLKVSQQAVSDAFVRSGYRRMRTVEERIEESLAEYSRRMSGEGT